MKSDSPSAQAAAPAAEVACRPSAEKAQRESPRPSPAAPSTRRWRSAELFGAGHEIEIEHGQAVYRLRLTSLGKLILTK